MTTPFDGAALLDVAPFIVLLERLTPEDRAVLAHVNNRAWDRELRAKRQYRALTAALPAWASQQLRSRLDEDYKRERLECGLRAANERLEIELMHDAGDFEICRRAEDLGPWTVAIEHGLEVIRELSPCAS